MKPEFWDLTVKIVRFVEDHQPGLVECEFADIEGRVHRFIEKIPVVSRADLWSDTPYPQSGMIRCQLLETWSDAHGRQVARISTERPWAIASTEGLHEFVVVFSGLEPSAPA